MPAGDGGEGDREVTGLQTQASSGHRGQEFTSSEGRPALGRGMCHPSEGVLSEELAGPRATPTVRKAPKEEISRAMSPMPGMGRLRSPPDQQQPLQGLSGTWPGGDSARGLEPGAVAPPGLQQDREALGEGSPVQAPVPLAAGASPAEPGVSRSSLGARRALEPPPSPAPTLLPSGPWPRPLVQKGPLGVSGAPGRSGPAVRGWSKRQGAAGAAGALRGSGGGLVSKKPCLSLLSVYPSASRGQAVTEQLGVRAWCLHPCLWDPSPKQSPGLLQEDRPGFRKAAVPTLDLVRPSGPRWMVVTPASWAESPHPVCLQLL